MVTPFLASLMEEADTILPRLFAGCRLTPVAGGYVGRCPFHPGAASPTLFVSSVSPLWRCFAGHEGGDWFAYLAAREGLNVPEAAQALARLAGMAAPNLKGFNETLWRRADRRASFLWVAEHLFMGRLWTKHGRAVVAALHGAGLSDAEIVARGIGMAVAPDDLVAYLRKKGVFGAALFEATGLAAGEYTGPLGETVAVRDGLGKIVGFTAAF
ncbi:MAG: hypothetical protein HQK87_10650 [Nitrospinae bacterium]|nr:hypothetical protein [Nitrospinota bacterium]